MKSKNKYPGEVMPDSSVDLARPANAYLPSGSTIKFFTLLCLWVIAFIPIYPDLVSAWLKHSNNSHGALVPLITVYLIWLKRRQLANVYICSSNLGGLILFLSLSLYLISYAGSVAVVSRAMIVFSLIGIVLFNFGNAFFSIIAFPLLYLIFMVPVPISVYGLVAFPLQLFATKISAHLIQLLSIPVLREGNMLYFAETQLEVAEACSGLRSMMAFIMLAFLFAHIMDKSMWKRIIIIFAAIPLAIFANIVRVTGTGILAHYYGEKVARGFLHEFSGLAVFVFGFVLLFFVYVMLGKSFGKK